MDNVKCFKNICYESRKKIGLVMSFFTDYCNEFCVGYFDVVCKTGKEKCTVKTNIKAMEKLKRYFNDQLNQLRI